MRLRLRNLPLAALVLAGGVYAAPFAAAAELIIGRSNEPQSIDPQFSRTGPNQMTAVEIFDRLVNTDADSRAVPGLAESWTNIDPLTWEVKLRRGVKFHNGDAFDAQDVVFSLERAPNVPNSPASFAQGVASLDKIEVVDSHTLKITSKDPDPLFVENLGTIYIVNKETTEGASSADFNSGKVAFGTGPYKFVEWVPADRLVMVRNDDYWGAKPAFEKATAKFITNDAARVAALLSGSVDMIDQVPPSDIPTLSKDSKVALFTRGSGRLVYFALNQRDDAPFVTDIKGQPLPKNPFQDARVRKAVSLMIDRNAIVDRILSGQGEPAGQLVPEGMFGHAADVPAPTVDVKAAKKLLAEAGYPDGFAVTIHCSNDRFSLDGEVTQAVGQLLARGGLKIEKVETLPYSVYTKAAGKGDYGFFCFSYGNSTGEAGRGLSSIIHTYDKPNDIGTLNRFRYSNPKVDKLIVAAVQEFDSDKRWKMLADATKAAFEDVAVVPLYWQSLTWATRKGLTYSPRRDERTLASATAPAN